MTQYHGWLDSRGRKVFVNIDRMDTITEVDDQAHIRMANGQVVIVDRKFDDVVADLQAVV